MDEIEILEKIKKSIIRVSIIILPVFAFIAVITFLIYPTKTSFMTSIITFGFGIAISIINFIIYGIIQAIYKIKNVDIDLTNDEFERELDNLYPPAIVSFIYNMQIEVYRDYTSTILQLYVKKYIDIVDFNEDVKIYKGNNTDFNKLLKHERYVYECIINNGKFDEEEFRELIIEDAKSAGLIIEKDSISNKKRLGISIVAIIGTFILSMIIEKMGKFNEILEIIEGILLCIIMIEILFGTGLYRKCCTILVGSVKGYKLKKNGKELLKRSKRLKNYLKQYTLISEKNIDFVQLLNEYIPYALSLGVADEVEKYIKENEKYRKLIYGEEK